MAVIRRAERRDRDRMLALWQECGLEPTEEDEWESLVGGGSNAILAAQEGDRIVGSAIATFDGWRAYIYHVAVAPDDRKQGLGRELMVAAEDYLRQAGARRVYIEVDQENTAGLALAAMLGYLPEGEIVLEKELKVTAGGGRSAW
jgi:ribosomal protein S18 acetylase RimI-like enzyme